MSLVDIVRGEGGFQIDKIAFWKISASPFAKTGPAASQTFIQEMKSNCSGSKTALFVTKYLFKALFENINIEEHFGY